MDIHATCRTCTARLCSLGHSMEGVETTALFGYTCMLSSRFLVLLFRSVTGKGDDGTWYFVHTLICSLYAIVSVYMYLHVRD